MWDRAHSHTRVALFSPCCLWWLRLSGLYMQSLSPLDRLSVEAFFLSSIEKKLCSLQQGDPQAVFVAVVQNDFPPIKKKTEWNYHFIKVNYTFLNSCWYWGSCDFDNADTVRLIFQPLFDIMNSCLLHYKDCLKYEALMMIWFCFLSTSPAPREQLRCRQGSTAAGQEACTKTHREVLVRGWSGKGLFKMSLHLWH